MITCLTGESPTQAVGHGTLVLLDLSAAFDTVDKVILLDDSFALEIDGIVLNGSGTV